MVVIDETFEVNAEMQTILDRLFMDARTNGSNLFSKDSKDANEYIIVQCPYHKFGQERKPSAQFRKSDGTFYCHGCKETHSLPDVILHCLNINGKTWLSDNFQTGVNIVTKINFNISGQTDKPKAHYIDKSILEKYRFLHPYMFKRKLDLLTIRKFDIGYNKEKNCITFPNKDQYGNILFIATRNVDNKFFHYPTGVDKPVYGLYEIYREMKKGVVINEIYICESMFNCLTLWAWGKYAVALNGTGSKKQLDILRKTPFISFILALDPDAAGDAGCEKIYKNITNKIIKKLDIPKGKDVNDLEYEEFEKLEVRNWFISKLK